MRTANTNTIGIVTYRKANQLRRNLWVAYYRRISPKDYHLYATRKSTMCRNSKPDRSGGPPGRCVYGSNCAFAHTPSDLAIVLPHLNAHQEKYLNCGVEGVRHSAPMKLERLLKIFGSTNNYFQLNSRSMDGERKRVGSGWLKKARPLKRVACEERKRVTQGGSKRVFVVRNKRRKIDESKSSPLLSTQEAAAETIELFEQLIKEQPCFKDCKVPSKSGIIQYLNSLEPSSVLRRASP